MADSRVRKLQDKPKPSSCARKQESAQSEKDMSKNTETKLKGLLLAKSGSI